jgi:hypothetical protein
MSEPRSVETNDTVVACKEIHDPADRKILDHRAVAMEQHDTGRIGVPTINVVKPDSLTSDKLPDGRVSSFRDPLERPVSDDQSDHDNDYDDNNDFCL